MRSIPSLSLAALIAALITLFARTAVACETEGPKLFISFPETDYVFGVPGNAVEFEVEIDLSILTPGPLDPDATRITVLVTNENGKVTARANSVKPGLFKEEWKGGVQPCRPNHSDSPTYVSWYREENDLLRVDIELLRAYTKARQAKELAIMACINSKRYPVKVLKTAD